MGKRKVKNKVVIDEKAKELVEEIKSDEYEPEPKTNEKLRKAIHLREELLVKLGIFLKSQGLGQNATNIVFDAITAAEILKKVIDKESE